MSHQIKSREQSMGATSNSAANHLAQIPLISTHQSDFIGSAAERAGSHNSGSNKMGGGRACNFSGA